MSENWVTYTCCPQCGGVVHVEESAEPVVLDDAAKEAARPFRLHLAGPHGRRFPVGHKLQADCSHTHEVTDGA